MKILYAFLVFLVLATFPAYVAPYISLPSHYQLTCVLCTILTLPHASSFVALLCFALNEKSPQWPHLIIFPEFYSGDRHFVDTFKGYRKWSQCKTIHIANIKCSITKDSHHFSPKELMYYLRTHSFNNENKRVAAFYFLLSYEELFVSFVDNIYRRAFT